MGKVIRSDLFRLFKMKSFYIVFVLVALLNLAVGPLTKLMYNLGRMLAGSDEKALAELGSFMKEIKFFNVLNGPLGRVDTVIILLLVIWFAYADLAHGYIKNIAGQLSKKGNIVVSKLAVSGMIITIMMIAATVFQTVGYMLIVKVDFTSDLADAAILFCVRWLCLLAVCSVLLLVVVGAHSQTGGAVVSVVMGAGFLSLAYLGINTGINKLFKLDGFDIGEYMPDSVFHSALTLKDSNSIDTELVLKGVITAAAIILVINPLTIRIFNKKDVT